MKVISGEFVPEETEVDIEKRELLDEYSDIQLIDWCAKDSIAFANLTNS